MRFAERADEAAGGVAVGAEVAERRSGATVGRQVPFVDEGRGVRGVTGFVGPGSKPIPLTDEEVTAMGVERIPIVLHIEVGENVRVVSGPLENFIGRVEHLDPERQKVKLTVSMFGRETPVELDYVQVQKL